MIELYWDYVIVDVVAIIILILVLIRLVTSIS